MLTHFELYNYLDGYFKLTKEQQQYISLESLLKATTMWSNGDARCLVEKTKNNNIYIHGLYSLKQGKGKELLMYIFKAFPNKAFRLNCIGEGLNDYYKDLGFKVIFKQPYSNKEYFYEMIKYKGVDK